MQFAVGRKLNGKNGHLIVCAEDALEAALKVRSDFPQALITYVRRANRRGDARHPPVQRKSESSGTQTREQ